MTYFTARLLGSDTADFTSSAHGASKLPRRLLASFARGARTRLPLSLLLDQRKQSESPPSFNGSRDDRSPLRRTVTARGSLHFTDLRLPRNRPKPRGDGDESAELNRLLRGHRVFQLDRRFVGDGERSFWALCVDYQESGAVRPERETERKRLATYRRDRGMEFRLCSTQFVALDTAGRSSSCVGVSCNEWKRPRVWGVRIS